MERLDVEQAVLHMGGVILEPLIDATARAGGFAELAAGGDVFGLDATDGFLNERMVIGQARERGCGRFASGGAQYFVLRFRDRATFFVQPGERVVAIGGADVDHDAGGRLRASRGNAFGGNGGQGLGGKDNTGQIGDSLLERWISVAGVFPNLVSQRREVHFVVRRIVEDAGLFSEEVADDRVVLFILKKGFVRADDFGVFVETLADARAQADEALDALCRDKRVAQNFLGFLADTIHAARTLNEADDGPRQIEVHDDGGVLKVLTFAENVGGDQHAEFFGGRNVVGRPFVPRLVAVGAETAGVAGWLFVVAGDASHLL